MDFEEAGKNLIIETNKKLMEASKAYYAKAQPIMTDEHYDLLEKDLKSMVSKLPQFTGLATVLTKVGSDIVDDKGRVRHSRPMLSLENQYTFDNVEAFVDKFPEGAAFVVEPKIDGASLAVQYLNRQLVKAVTRGDGEYGEDVTRQMVASDAIEVTLNPEFYPDSLIEVRGEVYMTSQQFDAINAESEKKYASPRNLAAGSMKLQDLAAVKARGLKFYPWDVSGIPAEYLAKKHLSPDFAHHQITYFAATITRNFNPTFSVFHNAAEINKALDGYLRIYRDTAMHQGRGIMTDGYVIKVASPTLRKEVGVGSKCPNWAVAFKYPSQGAVTTLISVTWQVGRSGGLTPVGELVPVNIGGVMVSRANLNNWSWMLDKGIKEVPCQVEVARGGEVIPQIVRVLP